MRRRPSKYLMVTSHNLRFATFSFSCFKGFDFGDFLISGDTLFCGGVGRTDFPHSVPGKIIPSIKEKLMTLKDNVIVYPGHGPQTTIGLERESNVFLTQMNF